MKSVELLLSMEIVESQRLGFMKELLTGAPLTQEQQQQPHEVHETLDVPWFKIPFEDG